MNRSSYGHTRILSGISFTKALERVNAALSEEGFGVLTEIDVKTTLKKKLDVDFRNYKILGACNPPLAHQALTGEPLIGLLLPCNIAVFEEDDGTINVSVIKAQEMFKVVDNPEVEPIARQVDEKLVQVLERL